MSEKRILNLTLHRCFFEQIAIGFKRQEYRDKKPYWTRRLVGRTFDEVHFRNGYGPYAPFLRAEWKGMDDMGSYYVIRLGDVLEVRR